MNEQEANKFVIDTFQSEYNDVKFRKFINELLNGGELKYGSLTSKDVKTAPYNEYIQDYKYFGVYTDSNGKRILFLSVHLIRGTSRDRARVMQRNFAADFLRGKISNINGGNAALIAFYDDVKEDWRLSFVTLETDLICDDKGVCVSERLSSAKRSSFLVGVHEPCHTCMKRFSPLIKDGANYPTLEQIADVFHVETVTKEFFEKYKECYLKLNDSLQEVINNDEVVLKEFEKKNLIVSDFSKKLLGQIVFLYFLQKKGWLGVKRGENWGTGPKDFMSQLFSGKIIQYTNFFDDILEPLFYEALAKKNDFDYYSRFGVRIPFLNGGLFEADYDWVNTNIVIDNSVFKEIFDTFDLYNFTVKEDEPLEREVAVDPEMLGKVFENLLEIIDRKSKGAFYTPRYIVHYICQQSLIEYLSKHIDAPRSDIELFVRNGDEMYAATVKHLLDSTYNKESVSNKDGLPESISSNAKEIDILLRDIKIADPAVGSGAFPVGMMNEIVKARNALTFCFTEGKNERTSYNLKRETIEHSIYGVDLDPSAVDISKLRFWLSLIVDEENPKEIQTLPNLDHKIMAGNSLIENYDGIRLFDSEILSDELDSTFEILSDIEDEIRRLTSEQNDIPWGEDRYKYEKLSVEIQNLKKRKERLLRDEPQKEINQSLSSTKTASYKKSRKGLKYYRVLQNQYFNEQDKKKKDEIRNRMDVLEWDIIEREVELSGNKKIINELKNLKGKRGKPFFLWKLYFPEVFMRENPGFDCVIGNPPYIQLQGMDNSIKKNYEDAGFSTYASTGDIYCLFYEKGYNLLRNSGTLGYITSNKWMRAGYGQNIRGFFAEKTNPLVLIDFAGQKIFEEATVDVNILIFSKSENTKQTIACHVKKNCSENMSDYIIQNSEKREFSNANSWAILSPIEQRIKDKIEKQGTQLKDWDITINYGIKTGLNEAFIIDEDTKNRLIAEDSKSAEIIRPILRGRNIKKYGYEDEKLWLIATFPSLHYDIDKFPAVKDYLSGFGIKRLEQTGKEYLIDNVKIKARKKTNNKWFETQDSISYWEDFFKQKIAYNDITQRLSFSLVEEGIFMNNTVYFISYNEHMKYLLAILNSKLIDWYYKSLSVQLGEKAVRMFSIYVLKIPVLMPSDDIETKINDLVNKLLIEKKLGENIHNIENEIDNIVYSEYKLTNDEIKYINEYYSS